ncbi:hypothetical protein C1646_771312 [Rhizophagus diaphanus]|nr:hypothetical protein C1646_771312 [Rhizophagus diaphanus] [Rhizophagus sp. MUCL 43196]
MGKNIVVLYDGTWNNPSSQTNIYTLYKELLEEDYKQRVLYIDGIGIGELTCINLLIDGDMAIALSLDNKIKEGYKFIVNHYNPGDDIWLFGFSRGAYIVRCIAGMIKNCGILKVDREIKPDQIDKRVDLAYDIYRDRDMDHHPEGKESQDFKKAFSHPESKEQIIKFLGLWDTVGAHGLPAYTIGEETWFPGVHCEVGRGSFLNFKSNEKMIKASLLWMIENIEQILYRDGDWLLPFGTRSNLCAQYDSNTYEELRKDMETKGIKLHNNVTYDKDINEEAHEGTHIIV